MESLGGLSGTKHSAEGRCTRSRLAGTFLVPSESDSEPWDPDSKSIPIAHTSVVLVVLSVCSTSLTMKIMIQVSKAM